MGFILTLISSGDAGPIAKAGKKSFFRSAPKETAASVFPSFDPENERSLTVNENGGLIIAFHWWLNRLLDPTCVPSIEFVTQNIQLYPANTQHPEDVAALLFDIEDDHYQVVQTYDLFCVLIEPGKVTTMEAKDIQMKVEGMMNGLLHCRMTKPAGIASVAKPGTVTLVSTNGVYVGSSSLDGIAVKVLTNGKEICISVRKRQFEETVEAHVPMPNEWFSWEREKTKPRQAQTNADRRNAKTPPVRCAEALQETKQPPEGNEHQAQTESNRQADETARHEVNGPTH